MNVGNLQLDAKVYRTYNNDMNLISSVNKTVKNISNVIYQASDTFNKSVVDSLSIDKALEIVKQNYDMNENYYDLQLRLYKQIMYYGEKEAPDIDLESDNEEL
jgi:hypothetical protein